MGGRAFSKEETKLLDELMRDIITYKLNENEGMKYIEAKFKAISLSGYKLRHARVNSDKSTNTWLNYFTRIGFVLHHKKQMEDAIRIQDHSLRDFITEISRPLEERDHDRIYKIKNDIRENIRLLTDLGLGTPIISALKAKLDKVEDQHATSIQSNTKSVIVGR